MIDIEGLTMEFGNTVALQGLNLTVEPGAIFGFLGPNGAGKTTTIRLMLGLLTPSNGSCRVMGFDSITESDHIRSAAGVLLEHSGIYERLTVEENLLFFGLVNRLDQPALNHRITEVLNRFDLWSRRGHRAGTLSKGMRQKVGIARAVLHRPKLLLLDEPTSGLDPESAARVRADLVALAEEGVTVFLTTHDLDEVERICTRVAVVDSGRTRAEGTVEELLARVAPRGHRVRISEPVPALAEALRKWDPHASIGPTDIVIDFGAGLHSVAELVEFLVHRGAKIEEVRPVGSKIEAAYLSLLSGDQHVA